jgi:hypothetical protein
MKTSHSVFRAHSGLHLNRRSILGARRSMHWRSAPDDRHTSTAYVYHAVASSRCIHQRDCGGNDHQFTRAGARRGLAAKSLGIRGVICHQWEQSGCLSVYNHLLKDVSLRWTSTSLMIGCSHRQRTNCPTCILRITGVMQVVQRRDRWFIDSCMRSGAPTSSTDLSTGWLLEWHTLRGPHAPTR